MLKSGQIQKTRKILVVDDQELNRDILGVILEEESEVIYACNGREALEKIRENKESLSLIMLDIFMPEMNGFEVLEAMAADDLLKRIPVIVLTSEKSAELKALELGAADFITKPFDVHDVILVRARRIIELNEKRNLIFSAEHDKLTMLYTRGFFFEYAERLYKYHPELHMDAVVLNIEQFHSLNELNGRDFGDEVLQIIGREIGDFLAETEGIASRIVADRFDIYCAHQDDYRALLDRLQNKVNGIAPNVSIRLRMGVMPWREGIDPVLMFDRAKTACSMVRGKYTNPLMIYDEDMHMHELLDRRLLNDLNLAVKENQLMVYFQPKYNIQVDPPMLSSAEALIRWKHPELGMISPGAFIPLFEKNGLISIVDNFVWKNTAKQISEWKEKFGITLPVSVNVSRADIFDLTLAERLKGLVHENGLVFKCLKLEITESAYIDNARQLLDLVSELRQLGFEIEMDDFGSGYSSLNMLSSMPVDVLKIDMKFIRNIERNETDRKLVTMILDIAKFMKLTVVAEGVETDGQLEILKKAGCDIVQGYYVSRPLPADEFEKLIEKELKTERGKK
ncbi:MAG: EAL domain-containing protein [Clostridia bacterium]|nr:EAL domain-containing protein [Clostridia bacterium]